MKPIPDPFGLRRFRLRKPDPTERLAAPPDTAVPTPVVEHRTRAEELAGQVSVGPFRLVEDPNVPPGILVPEDAFAGTSHVMVEDDHGWQVKPLNAFVHLSKDMLDDEPGLLGRLVEHQRQALAEKDAADWERNMIAFRFEVPPTDPEVIERNRREAAERAEREALWIEDLAASFRFAGPLALRLWDLHPPDDLRYCKGCGVDTEMGDPVVRWPCPTIEAVAEHHGIDLTGP